jgi:hypothetical protein
MSQRGRLVGLTLGLAVSMLVFGQSPGQQAKNAAQQLNADLSQKQLVMSVTCQEAYDAVGNPKEFGGKPADYRDEALLAIENCAAVAHNQQDPKNPQVVVVVADPRKSTDTKVFFKTIPANDAKAAHDLCVTAGQATFTYLEVVANLAPVAKGVVIGADVLTDSGKVNCDGYLHAAQVDNPLVVLTPGIVEGNAVTVHVLNQIGLKKPAKEVQASVDELGHKAASVIAKSFAEIQKQPLVLVLGPGGAAITRPTQNLPLPGPTTLPKLCGKIRYDCQKKFPYHCKQVC